MARAQLYMDDSLREAFREAASSASSSTRVIKAAIEGETVTLHSPPMPRVGDQAQDFDSLLPSAVAEDEAALLFFALDGAEGWVLIAWVPDMCKVRDKMLYSSSRECVKQHLGKSLFVGEYYANTVEDITYQQWREHADRAHEDKPLTEAEVLAKEENALTRSEGQTTKSTAMGVIPFQLSDQLKGALQAFGRGSTNWVEMSLDVDTERVDLVESRTVNTSAGLDQHVNASEGRFLAVAVDHAGERVPFFIYSCPETVPIRAKMVMSTCKATVVGEAEVLGVTFAKTLEIRGADELDWTIESEMKSRDAAGDSAASPAGGAARSPVLDTSERHARPARPGRGRARMNRKR